jgi:hypothetical protein
MGHLQLSSNTVPLELLTGDTDAEILMKSTAIFVSEFVSSKLSSLNVDLSSPPAW